MRYKAICLIICSFLAAKSAEALEICGDLRQGELILLKDNTASKIIVSNNLKDREYKVDNTGVALVSLHRDVPQKITLKTYNKDGTESSYELGVTPTKWDIQRINGVAGHHVTPSQSHQKEINRELNDVNKALSVRSDRRIGAQQRETDAGGSCTSGNAKMPHACALCVEFCMEPGPGGSW